MFLGEVLCRAGGGPLEPEYVINLIGGRSISMENAAQRTFPARPTLCHKCKFRNIPGLTISSTDSVFRPSP